MFLSGFEVVVLEIASPLAVRRCVSFAEALFRGRADVEGVEGRRVDRSALLALGPLRTFVPVLVDPEAECLPVFRPEVLVDGRMLKRRADTRRDQAPLVIGLGPGFVAGEDVHVAVETQRGPDLGRLVWQGATHPDDGVPGEVGGETTRRVLRAPRGGLFRASVPLGALVSAGTIVGEIEGQPVRAAIDGRVRGLLADGVHVETGTKVGDVDPRGAAIDPRRLSDKGQAVAAAVLDAVKALSRTAS